MNVFHQLGQADERFDQINSEANRVRRRKPNPFQTGNLMYGFQELDERRFVFLFGKFVPAVQVNNLAEKRDLLDPSTNQPADFFDNLRDWTAAFRSSGIGHDTESAMHVAP